MQFCSYLDFCEFFLQVCKIGVALVLMALAANALNASK